MFDKWNKTLKNKFAARFKIIKCLAVKKCHMDGLVIMVIFDKAFLSKEWSQEVSKKIYFCFIILIEILYFA